MLDPTCNMVTIYASAQNKKQFENQLFLQIKLGRIINILWAFLIKQLLRNSRTHME